MEGISGDYIGWTVGIAGIVIPLLAAYLIYLATHRRKLKALYRVMSKKSTRLKPQQVMQLRGTKKGGFREYCLSRDQIEEVKRRIAGGKDVLVIGAPLSGKTRAVYEALIKPLKARTVTIPRIVDVNPVDFRIPRRLSLWRKRLLLVDDINKYVSKQHFEHLLQQYIDNGYLIVATCRKGPELGRAKSALEQIFASLFNDPVVMGKVSREDAQTAAQATGLEMPDSFDGNIGSVFIELETMRQRYDNCSDEGGAVLQSIKRLFMGGVYDEGGIYSEGHIKKVCEEIEELKLKKFKWQPVIESLANLSFLRPGKEGIAVEETYIEQIFTVDCSLLDNFRELADLFADDPDALFKVANRANNTDYSAELGDDYVRVKRLAVQSFQGVLSHWSLKTHPERYARTQGSLGNALQRLADIENKAANCKKAIAAYQEALKIYTLERFPMDYAMTQNNLGLASQNLGDIEDKAANCKKAIAAYQEALKVCTLERFAIPYAATQNNLGNAYGNLGDIEDKATNCKKAIAAYQEALKVRTLERFPTDYAMTQNNLGIVYKNLGNIKDKAANCKKAIAACQEALKVRTLERFPTHYAMTQNNLGNALSELGKVEGKAANCQKAIAAYQEALKVSTLERFPIQYAMTQNNLGNACANLGDIEDRAANCQKAIAAYQEALKVRTLERFPIQYTMTQNNLGTAYERLGDIEDKAANCKKAIAAFQEALKVRTLERFPMDYAMTQNNLGIAYGSLGDIEDKAANCKKAREAYEAALAVYRKLNMPLQVQMVEHNLALLDAFEAEE